MVYLLVACKTPASRLILHNSNSLGLGPSCRSLSDPDVVINMYRNSFPVSILFLNFLSFPMHEMFLWRNLVQDNKWWQQDHNHFLAIGFFNCFMLLKIRFVFAFYRSFIVFLRGAQSFWAINSGALRGAPLLRKNDKAIEVSFDRAQKTRKSDSNSVHHHMDPNAIFRVTEYYPWVPENAF